MLSRYRFDKHLSRKTNHPTSDTESSEEEIPTRHSRRRLHKDYIPSPSSTDEESDEPVRRKEHKPRFKSSPPREPRHKKKQEDDVGNLISKMGQLNLSDPRLQNLCLIQRDPRFNNQPNRPRGGFDRNVFTANNQFQRDITPHQYHQDMPPQQFRNSRPGPNQSRPYCYGCGQGGH